MLFQVPDEYTITYPPLPPVSSSGTPNSLGLRMEADARLFDAGNRAVTIRCESYVGSRRDVVNKTIHMAHVNNQRLSAGDLRNGGSGDMIRGSPQQHLFAVILIFLGLYFSTWLPVGAWDAGSVAFAASTSLLQSPSSLRRSIHEAELAERCHRHSSHMAHVTILRLIPTSVRGWMSVVRSIAVVADGGRVTMTRRIIRECSTAATVTAISSFLDSSISRRWSFADSRWHLNLDDVCHDVRQRLQRWQAKVTDSSISIQTLVRDLLRPINRQRATAVKHQIMRFYKS